MTNKIQIGLYVLSKFWQLYPVNGASSKYLCFPVCTLDYFCRMFIIINFNNKFKSLFLYWLWESLIGLPNLADISLGGHFMSIIHASRLPKISLYALPLIRASSYPWLFCRKSWIDKISGIDFVMKLYQYTYSLWWALLACLQN